MFEWFGTLWLQSAWAFVASTASISTIVGGIAIAIAVLLPKQLDFITDLRKWAIVVAAVAFSYTSVAGKFYNDGLNEKQRQWDNALVSESRNGEAARTDAERTVGPVISDRSLFRDDPFNRNRTGKRDACEVGK